MGCISSKQQATSPSRLVTQTVLLSETMNTLEGVSLTEQPSQKSGQQALDLKQVERSIDVFLEKMAYCRLPIGETYAQLLIAAQHLKSEITTRIAQGEGQSPERYQQRLASIQQRYNVVSAAAYKQQTQNLIAALPMRASSSRHR